MQLQVESECPKAEAPQSFCNPWRNFLKLNISTENLNVLNFWDRMLPRLTWPLKVQDFNPGWIIWALMAYLGTLPKSLVAYRAWLSVYLLLK